MSTKPAAKVSVSATAVLVREGGQEWGVLANGCLDAAFQCLSFPFRLGALQTQPGHPKIKAYQFSAN